MRSPDPARPGLRRPVFWILAALLLAADLATKALAWRYVGEDGAVVHPVAGWSWLAFTRLYNSGGVFGLFQGYTLPLTVFRLAAAGAILWLLARQPAENGRGVLVLALLFAGALGNLFDNLSRWMPWPGNGFVRDFVLVDLGFWPLHPWPVFNLADACISVGFVALITGLARVRVQAAAPA